jgi:WD40 repeat protein
MRRWRSDLKILLKLIIVAMANLVFMPWVPNIYADGCTSLGSGLRINISGIDESWLFIWSASGIEKQKNVHSWEDSDERLNIHRPSSDKRSGELPQDLLGPGMRLDVPFAVSHNGQMLISSIYPEGFVLIISKRFAIIDLKSRKLLRVIDTGYYVHSLAFSPTDKYIAVLLSQDVTSQKWKGPVDWIAKFLGHPRQYYTLYVDIYNSNGEIVCRKLLIEKLLQGRGYLDWE